MNTTAGAVAVQTKNPKIGSNEWQFHVTDGEHDDQTDYVVRNIAINDTMAARVMASYQNQDGVFYNPSLGANEGGREMNGYRGKFLWEPEDGASHPAQRRHPQDQASSRTFHCEPGARAAPASTRPTRPSSAA